MDGPSMMDGSFYDEGPFYEDDEPSSGSEVPIPDESGSSRYHKTDDEIQAMLHEPVDAESLAKRKGPGNQSVHYIPGHLVLRKANEIFGYNGWSSRIVSCDTVLCEKEGDQWHVCVLAKVLVWVGKGNQDMGHEDYGDSNLKGKDKGELLGRCHKAAVTDATKRALRRFGECLGNTCYDKDQIREIERSKKPKLTAGPPPPPPPKAIVPTSIPPRPAPQQASVPPPVPPRPAPVAPQPQANKENFDAGFETSTFFDDTPDNFWDDMPQPKPSTVPRPPGPPRIPMGPRGPHP